MLPPLSFSLLCLPPADILVDKLIALHSIDFAAITTACGAAGFQKSRNYERSKILPLSLDFEGKHYNGTVIPSEEIAPNGLPVYFRVSLGNSLFAYLCCSDNGWLERDGHSQPSPLINAIGNYINLHYEHQPKN